MHKHIKEHLLTILTVISVSLGIATGFILRAIYLKEDGDKFKSRTVMYVSFPGDIFLKILKSLILPLIISSLISAVGSLDISLSKQIGIRAILYYLFTTMMAVIMGIFLVIVIHPGGRGIERMEVEQITHTRPITTPDTFLDLIR